jgi:hypothetical protein
VHPSGARHDPVEVEDRRVEVLYADARVDASDALFAGPASGSDGMVSTLVKEPGGVGWAVCDMIVAPRSIGRRATLPGLVLRDVSLDGNEAIGAHRHRVDSTRADHRPQLRDRMDWVGTET